MSPRAVRKKSHLIKKAKHNNGSILGQASTDFWAPGIEMKIKPKTSVKVKRKTSSTRANAERNSQKRVVVPSAASNDEKYDFKF